MLTKVNTEIKELLFQKGFRYEQSKDISRNYTLNSLGEQRWNEGDLTYMDISIEEVLRWLLLKFDIWISVIDKDPKQVSWEAQISQKNLGLVYSTHQYPAQEVYNSPIAAYEAGIIYTLKNKI